MTKTVFISSTYQDLADHRRAVWQVLEGFHVAVRGMEQFGARKEAPLMTCQAEVGQSDIYVGIIAFRLGSIESKSRKSYTQLEYEHAKSLDKEILIYLANEQAKCFSSADIGREPEKHQLLEAFKAMLKEFHTVNWFSTPEDLAEKLRNDFKSRHLEPAVVEKHGTQESEFEATLSLVRRFKLVPRTVVGREIRLEITPILGVFPASRALCTAFNLEYGSTIGAQILILKPQDPAMAGFKEIYASGFGVGKFLSLVETREPFEIYARLEFTPDDVPHIQGDFFGGYKTYSEPEFEDPDLYYQAPEGKVILLFSKQAR